MKQEEQESNERLSVMKSHSDIPMEYSWIWDDWLNTQTSRYTNRKYNQQFTVLETEKFFIIVTSKGGSSITQNLLETNDLILNDFYDRKSLSHTFYKDYECFINPSTTYPKESPESIKEMVNLIDGKSKKDLILVTRNPIHKWMSGTIQDIQSSIADSSWVSELFDIPYNSKIKTQEDQDNENKLISKILIYRLKSLFKNKASTLDGHSMLYNEIFYQFLTLNDKIDNSKLKIVDIDNPNHDLVQVISEYFPSIKIDESATSYWTHRMNWNDIYGDLSNTLLKQDDEWLYNLITSEINNDYHYYRLILSKFKNNLYKPKK